MKKDAGSLKKKIFSFGSYKNTNTLNKKSQRKVSEDEFAFNPFSMGNENSQLNKKGYDEGEYE